MSDVVNLEVTRGASFTMTVEEQDENLAPISNVGVTARLQVRPAADSTTVLITLTEGSGLTMGGANGICTVRFTAAQTALIVASCVYDLRYQNDSDATDVRFPIEVSTITGSDPVTEP